MTIEFVAKLLFGYDSNKSKERLGEKFSHISQGLLSFPLNIPGTTYYSCLKVTLLIFCSTMAVFSSTQQVPTTRIFPIFAKTVVHMLYMYM